MTKPQTSLWVELDTKKQTEKSIQQYVKHHKTLTRVKFRTTNGEKSNTTERYFNKFLDQALSITSKQELLSTYSFFFCGVPVYFDEATKLSQIINKTKSSYLSLTFRCYVSETAFACIMWDYVRNINNAEFHGCHCKQQRQQKRKNRIKISGNGIRCCHIKFLNQKLLSSVIGSLSIYNAGICDEGASILANALCQNTGLTSLDLSRNKIGLCGAEAIGNMLYENSSIKSLNLSNNCIGNDGVMALSKSLKANSSLEKLVLKGIGCGNQGLLALVDGLSQNCGLKHLGLDQNSFDDDDDFEGILALGALMKLNSTIKELSLDNRFFSAYSSRWIGGFLNQLDGKTGKLTIDLCGNVKSHHRNDAFDLMMNCNAPKLVLDLSDNNLGPNNIETIANGIREQTFNVESLDLMHATVNDESIMRLFSAMVERKLSTSLVSLSLRNVDGITNVGARRIVDKLPLTKLQCLYLDGIPIGDDGVQQIASYLNDTELKELGLDKVGMKDSGLIALSNALKCKNAQLTFLGIYGNAGITSLGNQVLLDTVKNYNRTLIGINCNRHKDYEFYNDIKFYTALNRTKWKEICDPGFVSVSLIPTILENITCQESSSSSSVVYWILRTCPHIYFYHSSHE